MALIGLSANECMQIDIKTHIGQFALAVKATVIAAKQNDVDTLAMYHLLVHDSASRFYKDHEGKRKEMQYDEKLNPKVEESVRAMTKELFVIDEIVVSQYVSKTKPAPTLAEQLAGLGYSPEQIAEIVKGAKPEVSAPESPETISES